MATHRVNTYLKRSERERINKRNNIRNFEIEQVEEVIINRGKIDPIILLSLIILVTFGVIMVFSASYYVGKTKYDDILYFFKKQGGFALLGFLVLPIITKIDWRLYKNFSKIYCIYYILNFSFIYW